MVVILQEDKEFPTLITTMIIIEKLRIVIFHMSHSLGYTCRDCIRAVTILQRTTSANVLQASWRFEFVRETNLAVPILTKCRRLT